MAMFLAIKNGSASVARLSGRGQLGLLLVQADRWTRKSRITAFRAQVDHSLYRGAYLNRRLSVIARRLERKGCAMSPDAYEVTTQRIDAEFDIPQYDVSNLIRSIVANRGRLPPDGRNRYRYLPDAVLQRIEAIVCEVFRIETIS
jgi:hypothetical protein